MRIPSFVTVAALLLLTGSAAAQVTVLTHATLIDGTGALPQSDVTIVMENGRIRDIGSAAAISVPTNAAVANLAGK
jgi:hypothetical protein